MFSVDWGEQDSSFIFHKFFSLVQSVLGFVVCLGGLLQGTPAFV